MENNKEITPMQELMNWMDSEDCHIDQYAIEQVKEKIIEFQAKEANSEGQTVYPNKEYMDKNNIKHD